MGFKKWLAAITGSGMLGMAAAGGGVIGLVVIGVTGYNILMEPDKLPEEEEEDIAKVHRLGYGECECNCVYIGEAGDTSGTGGGTGSVSNSATGSGPVTFTGTEDKSNFANSAFYFTKIACDELGVPIWIPYAKNSGEDGGSIFNNSVTWNPAAYAGLDANVSTDNIARKSLDKGAAGFFQVEGVSVQDEMKFIHNNPTKYDNIISKSGLDVSKYPGMQSRLTKEHSIKWTNWYDDCTYYPAALINMLEAFKERKQISIDKHWLDGYDWFQSATDAEKDLLHTYTALTLWNNGIYAIDKGQNCYNSNPLFAKFLYALLDITRNKYDAFINTKFPGTYGNSGNGAEITAHTAPARWIIENSSVLTDDEKRAFDAEFRKNGGGDYHVVMLRRFCSYGTVLIYNGMSTLSDQSALNGLATNGITITGGWSLLSSGNTENLGQQQNTGTISGMVSGGANNLINNIKTNNPSGDNRNTSGNNGGVLDRVEGTIYIGDSRFNGMEMHLKRGGEYVVAKDSEGYRWFTSTALTTIKSIKDKHSEVSKWTIVSGLGVNDLYNINNYISAYEELEKNGDRVVLVSVNPTDGKSESLNKDIDEFNSKLQGTSFEYIDTNGTLRSNGFSTVDGVHYTKDTYTTIWNEINSYLSSNTGSGSGTQVASKVPNTGTNNSDRNSGGTGNLGSSGGGNTLGKLIDDPSVNPNGYPIYDNYTFNSDKYGYWDTNYEQFWNGSVSTDHPLSTLGDYKDHFINYADADHANTVAVENDNPKSVLPGSNASGRVAASGLEIVDGRAVMAIPLRVYQEPGDALNQVLEWAKVENNYTDEGRTYDPPTLQKADGVVNQALGLYFDVVLDDGTVIACMAGDAKAAHIGTHKSYANTYFDDTVSDGYCQYTRWQTKTGRRYSMCILESCHSTNIKPIQNMLKGHKIASIRSYKINYVTSGYQKYFTEGGSDSSFGLTGGSSSGGAKPGGTGNAAAGGTGGGTTTTNTGLNPNDPNWKCSCDIPCSKCMCHDNGVGGKPVGSDGDTVGSVTGGSFELKETPGVPQGLYCDLQGNPLSGSDVYAMFAATNPTMANDYTIGIGIAPPVSITTQDKWRDKFGDTTGAMNYLQAYSSGAVYGRLFHTYKGRGLDGYGYPHSNIEHNRFGYASCGFHSLSIIASTMLHKYITAPEIIMAGYLSPQLNPGPAANRNIYSTNMLNYKGAAAIMGTFRYKGDYLFNVEDGNGAQLNQAKLNATLDAGGMVSLAVHAIWSGGHFIVIRERGVDENGAEYYLTVDSSYSEASVGTKANPSVRHPFSDFMMTDPNQVNYITPGPAYEQYINDMMKGGSSGGGSVVGNGSETQNPNAPSTQEILSKSQAEIYQLLTDGKYSSYAEVNAAWAGGANKNAMKALFDSKVVSVSVPVWVWEDRNAGTKKSSTKNIQVSKQLENYFRDFMTDLYNCPEQYVINEIGGYCVRSKNTASGKSSSISGHSFGGTLDINWSSPYMSLAADYARDGSLLQEPIKSETCARKSSWFEVVKKYHLNWGGMWSKSYIDPMHFSIVGDGGEFPNYDYNNFKSGN